MANRPQAHISTTASSTGAALSPGPPDGVIKMVPVWDSHSKASFGVLWASECVPWPNRCSKRVPNGSLKGLQNELKTMVPTKTSKMWFRTLFATSQPCPSCLKTLTLGTLLGHLSGGPREVNERTSPKHTSQGAHGHLGGPKADFGVPRGVPFGSKILQNTVLEDMPCPLECQGGPEMGPKVPELTSNSALN